MAGGGSSTRSFEGTVSLLRAALEEAHLDPASFPISKRVFVSVHDDARVARAELEEWFAGVYGDPSGVAGSGVFGTPAQVGEQLEELAAMGANQLLLNPTSRYLEQTEMLAEVVGLDSLAPADLMRRGRRRSGAPMCPLISAVRYRRDDDSPQASLGGRPATARSCKSRGQDLACGWVMSRARGTFRGPLLRAVSSITSDRDQLNLSIGLTKRSAHVSVAPRTKNET